MNGNSKVPSSQGGANRSSDSIDHLDRIGCPKHLPIGSHWFPLVPIGSHWFPLVPIGSHWFPLVPIGYMVTRNQKGERQSGVLTY